MSDDKFRVSRDWNGDYIVEKDYGSGGGGGPGCGTIFTVIFGFLSLSPNISIFGLIYSIFYMWWYVGKNGYHSKAGIFCLVTSIIGIITFVILIIMHPEAFKS